MWARIASTLRRHKKKLIFFGGVIGGVAFLNTYLKRKFVEWESKRTLECIEQMKRASHFEGTITTCDSALLSFAPQIRGQVSSTVDVNTVLLQLRENPGNKTALWERLKVLVFTQAVGEMYAQCLLVVLLRVQMSILGGYIYSQLNKDKRLDAEATKKQQKYLSQITNFLIDGVNELLIPVEKAVREILTPIHLDQMIKLSDFSEYLECIRIKISQGTPNVIPNITQYFMLSDNKDANQNDDNSYDEFMENILRETKDVLECDDFTRVLSSSIEHGTAALMDRLSECYMFLSSGDSQFMNPNNLSAPFAKIIPIWYKVYSQHEPNEQGALIHTLLQQESLKAFAANIYEAFSQHSE